MTYITLFKDDNMQLCINIHIIYVYNYFNFKNVILLVHRNKYTRTTICYCFLIKYHVKTKNYNRADLNPGAFYYTQLDHDDIVVGALISDSVVHIAPLDMKGCICHFTK